MNSKQIGDVTELEVMLAFKKLGYTVLIPYGDYERYDLVVDDNGRFVRIQCKTALTDNDLATFYIMCISSHRKNGKVVSCRYSEKDVDFFATCFKGVCYLIPISSCGRQKRLRLAPPKNNQSKDIAWAKDYELEKIVKEW